MVDLLFRDEFLNHRGLVEFMDVYWRLVTEVADACGREAAWRVAQLCVSELVSNVITHVGRGTPATPAVSMSGTRLRIEVHDPDARALPVLVEATDDAETGRGMAIVAAHSDRWGVQLLAERKVTWGNSRPV
nr:ATP-binding protein [Streptomyces chattanoogensis]